MSLLFCIAAVIAFVLAAFGFSPGDASELDVDSIGLALFALAHIVPNGVSWPRTPKD